MTMLTYLLTGCLWALGGHAPPPPTTYFAHKISIVARTIHKTYLRMEDSDECLTNG